MKREKWIVIFSAYAQNLYSNPLTLHVKFLLAIQYSSCSSWSWNNSLVIKFYRINICRIWNYAFTWISIFSLSTSLCLSCICISSKNGNSFPSLETFVKIAQVLDIDINDFFNLTPVNDNSLRTEVYELVQTSSIPELHLIKDLIIAVKKHR